MRSKRTWLGALALGTALSAACGGDGGASAAPVGGGRNGGGGGSNNGSKTDGGADAGQVSRFPNDKSGPLIVVKQPVAASGKSPIVGGTVVVQASITDEPAGVNSTPEALFASIEYEGETVMFPGVAQEELFTFTFEAGDFKDRADLTVLVHAEDTEGNVTTKPIVMQLDTEPPWVSLDPPDIRLATASKDGLLCSANVDPIGDAAVADGDVVGPKVRFRAFAWERGIDLTPDVLDDEIFFAGVNEAEVVLYVQDDPDKPLLTDGPDKNDVCDGFDATAPHVALSAVKPAGAPATGEGTEGKDPDPEEGAICAGVSPTKAGAVTKPLCTANDMSYVPAHDEQVGATVVFGVMPQSSGGGCTGISWDPGTVSGWMCAVAVAYDKAAPDGKGNLGFSEPIRVCRALKDGDCKGRMPGDHLVPPKSLTCTDGCTLPRDTTVWGHPHILKK